MLEVTNSTDPAGTPVVRLDGEMDISNVHRLQAALRRFHRSKEPLIVLDLRGLTFIDSTGLRVIAQAHLSLKDVSKRLTIVRGPERVHEVFKVAGLEARLQFVGDPSQIPG